jgi:peptide/nickel transport system substrate-binding protein
MLRSMPSIFRRTTASLLLASAMLTAGAAAATAETLKVAAHSALRILDPMRTSAYIVRNHAYMIFDTLLATDADGKIRPQMADWTVSDDGMTYVFTLRDGLKWHDGTPVTAEDCVSSLKRWAQRDGQGVLLMDATESLTALDDKRLELKLKTPVGFVLEAIGKPSSFVPFMMPKRLADLPASEAITEMVGSGPFKFDQAAFNPGVLVAYDKNEDYVPRDEEPSGLAGGKFAKVDRVEWVAMPDPQTSVNALISGEIDYVESVPVDLLPLVEGNDEFVIDTLDPGYHITGIFNTLYPPFNDVRMRRAAMQALSQQDVMDALIGDPRFYKLCGAMFGCGNPHESTAGADMILGGGNAEEAKKLLDEAGYDGTKVVQLHPTDLVLLRAPGFVAGDALKKAGFNMDIHALDWQTATSRFNSQEAPENGGWNVMFTLLGVPDMADPIKNNLLNGKGKVGGTTGWLEDAKLEEYRAAYAVARTPEERQKIADDIQTYAYEQAVYVPLGQFFRVTAWSKNIDGIVRAPVTLFWNIEKK